MKLKKLIIVLLIGCCRVNPAIAQSPIQDTYDIIKVCLSEGFGTLSLRGPLQKRVLPIDTSLMVINLDSVEIRKSFIPVTTTSYLQWPSASTLQSMKSFLSHTKAPLNFSEKELKKRKLVSVDTMANRNDLMHMPLFRSGFPLISSNRHYALLYAEYSCEGDCGEGILFLLRSVNNRWIIIAKAEVWQS